MKSIRETCKPRADILTGAFNPEIFTASLSAVMDHYRQRTSAIANVYTDAEQFFREATYPTQGLRDVLSSVFGRQKGDNSLAAIHRLETAFGGGKTHALIAGAHIGIRGRELAGLVDEVLDPDLLPEPGEISVVGVYGDEIPVHEPRGKKLIPWTLWGEIAFQIGGEKLYKEVKEEATSPAAPGKPFLETVFADRKVIILIDELAQYAARLEAARPKGGQQLAAFLLSLHNYARTHARISVVLTLAGAADAFANQTQRLAELLSGVKGDEVTEDEALSLGQQALGDVQSVVARDATPLVPVQAAELSRVLAQRLLQQVDREAGRETAEAYMEVYRRSAQLLPDTATRVDFRDRMVANYPFHPTLIDFLNAKLSTVENFQGTRGVLRILALAVRSLWGKKQDVPMIHACHLDLRDARIASDLLGRTGTSDLLPVLNADIGGADTGHLEGGRSNAEEADLRNPHPQGYSMYEYTWKTVFLHSLAGREEGLGSNIFGIIEQEALFTVSFPGLTPPQVGEALEEINRSAFYLRKKQGRYFASREPSINHALARIRRSLSAETELIRQTLNSTARKVVKEGSGPFRVVPDVSLPEHVPDEGERPILALVALDAGSVDVEAFVTTKGGGAPRERQNLVFLLVPATVLASGGNGEQNLFQEKTEEAEAALKRIQDNALWALAIRELKRRPADYGINPARLDEDEFRQRAAEREQALEVSVAQAYNSLWFPSATGRIVSKEIKQAGGEGGKPIIELIRGTLLEAGEIVTKDDTTQADLTNLRELFFDQSDTAALEELRENFRSKRGWPVLESADVLERLVREGVSHGVWCLFRMGSEESIRPDEFYSREGEEVPFDLKLSEPGYSLVTPQGAKQRGWTVETGPDRHQLEQWVLEATRDYQAATVKQIAEHVIQRHGEVPEQQVVDSLAALIRISRLMSYRGAPDQAERPKLISGVEAALHVPSLEDVVITPAEASRRGWVTIKGRGFKLTGREGAEKVIPLLRRIGSLYARGATTTIDSLDLVDLGLPEDARLRLYLEKAPPGTLKRLGELFEVLSGVVTVSERTEVYLTISNPPEDCPFMKEIRDKKDKGKPGDGD